MAAPGNSAAYEKFLTLSHQLFTGQISEPDLPKVAATLPPLTQPLLETLAAAAQQASLTAPRRSWALMTTADAATQQTGDLFLQSLAAWHLAWAANAWVRPQRVEAAATRARKGFIALGREEWAAACAWQLNALPWTRPDYHQVLLELDHALAVLTASSLYDFVPDCRLSLAYAHMLTGQIEQAAALVKLSEAEFEAAGHAIGMGRCHLLHCSIMRRKSIYPIALDHLQKAFAIFEANNALVLIAQGQFQLAWLSWLNQANPQAAEELFSTAAQCFLTADIPLWQAQCLHGLGQIFTSRGKVLVAQQTLQQAGAIYRQYPLKGLVADVQLDMGQLEFLKGNLQRSITYYEQAAQLNKAIGNEWLQAVALMNQGECYLQLSRFQKGLGLLEQAYRLLQQSNFPQRLAACEQRLAAAWLRFNQPQLAEKMLQRAVIHYRESGRPHMLAEIHHMQALICYHNQDATQAIAFLQQALAVAESEPNEPQQTLSHRLLGEVLSATGQLEAAEQHLKLAEQLGQRLDMVMEQAACHNAWGHLHSLAGRPHLARAAWNKALELARGAIPELSWQAHQGLAMLEEKEQPALALSHYQRAGTALSRLRRDLWQPALAGAYLNRPVEMLDRAIAFASRSTAVLETLTFIEESKAQTLLQQWTLDLAPIELTDEIKELVAEIRWLEQAIRKSGTESASSLLSLPDLHQQFIMKVHQYDQMVARLERIEHTHASATASSSYHALNLHDLTHRTSSELGDDWVLMNFYQLAHGVCGVMVTAEESRMWFCEMTPSARFALEHCTRGGRRQHGWQSTQLALLGSWLFPPFIRSYFSAKRTLLISPHRRLHLIPWAALLIENQYLVETSIPAIIPSWQTLVQLWKRTEPLKTHPPHPRPHLLVAVSDFGGRHPELAAVPTEMAELTAYLSADSPVLANREATYSRLASLAQENGLAQFSHLYFATHAFADRLTGRFSGLALADRDIWLDELWQLGPLPPLVTLSACSGLAHQLYEGDEPVGLATSCLTAGASSVIGSLWPVADGQATGLMAMLLQRLKLGDSPAEALAQAQRTAVAADMESMAWGAMQCLGCP